MGIYLMALMASDHHQIQMVGRYGQGQHSPKVTKVIIKFLDFFVLLLSPPTVLIGEPYKCTEMFLRTIQILCEILKFDLQGQI